MATSSEPRILILKADAAIAKGSAVKFGTDDEHIAVCAATTDYSIGIAQNAATDAEDLVEVALPGGGAKGLAQTTVTRGQLLVAHTDGALKPIASANDRVVAVAMKSAVADDIFDVEVLLAQGTASE